MNREHQQALRLATKYKKMLESVEVTPNAYRKNDVLYFEAIYTNMRGRKTGSAILPVNGNGNEQDAMEAHTYLSLYNGQLVAIYKARGDSRIDDALMTEPISLLETETHPLLVKGKEEIESLHYWVSQFEKEFQEAAAFYKDPKVIKPADLDFLCEKASRMDVANFNMQKILLDEQDVFAMWRKTMKAEGLWKKLSRDQHLFYNGLIDEKFRVRKTMDSQVPIVGDTVEEQYKNTLAHIHSHNEKMELIYREQLRWPKV